MLHSFRGAGPGLDILKAVDDVATYGENTPQPRFDASPTQRKTIT
jgi:hypothetical protein